MHMQSAGKNQPNPTDPDVDKSGLNNSASDRVRSCTGRPKKNDDFQIFFSIVVLVHRCE